MPVLITGSDGQLGSDFRSLLPDATALNRHQLSITDRDAVKAAVSGHDLVLNCAAYNAVDAAEKDPGPAMTVNGEGPAILAEACRREGARLVHYSTNYVFDGTLQRPYLESDPTSPLGAYARSKAEGEQRVLRTLPEALVIRSSGLFGATGSAVKGGSFPERMVARARSGQPMRVVADQRLNPTYTYDLAQGTLDLVARGVSGVVHLVADGCCSYWELTLEALRLAGVDVEVGQATSDEFGAAAPRPLNGCLSSKVVAPLRDWHEGLAAWWTDYAARVAEQGLSRS
jgi:dTDP-4-dehydrorhamnose reductase